MLLICLMLAANGRAAIYEANYFTYRGESIKTMMNQTLELVEGTDKNVLCCLNPNYEGSRTLYYLFKLQDYHNMYNWYEEDGSIGKSKEEWYTEEASFDDMNVVVMYNRDDRH